MDARQGYRLGHRRIFDAAPRHPYPWFARSGARQAVSCGIFEGTPVLDLDYDEDSNAGADANFVLTGDSNIAEAQATAEGQTFDEEQLMRLMRLAKIGCGQIFEAQDRAVG